MNRLYSLFLLIAISKPLVAQDILEYPYGQSAEILVPSLINDLQYELRAFTPETWPHETKYLRKFIGRVKLHLDLFHFAYPVYGDAHQVDIWRIGRKLLDEGYFILGNYKDLFDRLLIPIEEINPEVDYDLEEVNLNRILVFNYIVKFQKFFSNNVIHYFQNPTLGSTRPPQFLAMPKYFWRYNANHPQADHKLRRVLIQLLSYLTQSSIDILPEVLELDNLLHKEQQERFHDLRKQTRFLTKFPKFYSTLFSEEELNHPDWLFTKELVDRFGALNDLILRYDYLTKKFREARPEEEDYWLDLLGNLRTTIFENWSENARWLQDNHLLEILKRLKYWLDHHDSLYTLGKHPLEAAGKRSQNQLNFDTI